MNDLKIYDEKQMEKLILETDQIMERFNGIPFGNSEIQNLYLITQDQMSPARKFRAYGLKLQDRKRALEENIFQLRKTKVKLKKLHRDLEKEKDEFEKELIQIEIDQTMNSLKYTKKLYQDCLEEIKTLSNIISKFPDYTREDFEKQEIEHFAKKLSGLMSGQHDAALGLEALGLSVSKNGNQIMVQKHKTDVDNILEGKLLPEDNIQNLKD